MNILQVVKKCSFYTKHAKLSHVFFIYNDKEQKWVLNVIKTLKQNSIRWGVRVRTCRVFREYRIGGCQVFLRGTGRFDSRRSMVLKTFYGTGKWNLYRGKLPLIKMGRNHSESEPADIQNTNVAKTYKR